MTYKVMDNGVVRDATPEEVIEIESRVGSVVVPQMVTRRQARQALMLDGYLDLVPVKIGAIPDPIARAMAQIEWEDSLEFMRDRPLVVQIGAALGLDSAGLDALFIKASKL